MPAPPFVIFALPRSRTYWLSKFLSYGGWNCSHEELRHMRSPEDIRVWTTLEAVGTAETAAAPFWRTLQRIAPETRVVVVRRSMKDVMLSLTSIRGMDWNVPVLWKEVRRLHLKLNQIAARWPGALSVTFDELKTEAGCARVFEHCLGLPHDPAWWAAMAPLNLQCDFLALIRYMEAYRPQLTKLAATARQQTLVALRQRPVVPPEGMTFQIETIETAFRDGQPLIRDHLVAVGESPDGQKNMPVFQHIEDIGALQIMTARANGRMFGYLVTIVFPSLENTNDTSAVHSVFYASPDAPGLGMKLHRAALAALRARGVDEVYYRAGPRGSGPKMGALYRRLGATADGEQYKLIVEH